MNTVNHPLGWLLLALLVLAGATPTANAASVIIECTREDMMVPGWTGPLTISYPGGESGDISVTSEHVTFSLPVRRIEMTETVDGTEMTATMISGSGATSSAMPDAEALIACATASLRPELKDDADVQALALLGCVPKVVMGASPIAVHADISVGLVPGNNPDAPDVNVQINRTYTDAKALAGGSLTIETYPGHCKLAGR